jgi:hypothetical protein
MNMERSMRRAAVLAAAGLAVQLGAAVHWTPGAFIVAAAVGVPLVLAGSLQFVVAVIRIMKSKGAL